jgi:O-antigen/teichoic acid export membrane protein
MAIANRLDQLVLSFAVAAATFGNYAVAASLTGLAMPIVAAVGNVAFPRLASRVLGPSCVVRLQRWSILVSATVAMTLMLALAVASPSLVPTIFGSEFRDAVPLIWLMAPGGVFLACVPRCAGTYCSVTDVRLRWARAQLWSVVAMAILLAILLPPLGAVELPSRPAWRRRLRW